MNERWFEEFGNVLDTLYHIMRNADEGYEDDIQEHYDALAEIYQNIKSDYGYTDSSDEYEDFR